MRSAGRDAVWRDANTDKLYRAVVTNRLQTKADFRGFATTILLENYVLELIELKNEEKK